MKLNDIIGDADPISDFLAGIGLAEAEVNLESVTANVEEMSKLYTGAYLNLLDDAEHDFSPEFRLKARATLENIAERHGMDYSEFKDLIKYNSEGVIGAIVNAILAFFKVIIDFFKALFGFNSGGGSSGGASTKDVASGKVSVKEAIEEAKEMLEETPEEVKEDTEEAPKEETPEETREERNKRYARELYFKIEDLTRRIEEFREKNRRSAMKYMTTVALVHRYYGINMIEDNYFNIDANIETFKSGISRNPDSVILEMPKYENTDGYIDMIKRTTNDVDFSEYPEYAITSIGASYTELDNGDGDLFIDLIIFATDCNYVKKVTQYRAKIGTISQHINVHREEAIDYVVKSEIARYVDKHRKSLKKLPDPKKIFKTLKTMEKEFKAMNHNEVNEAIKAIMLEKGCGEIHMDYFNDYVIKTLKLFKSLAMSMLHFKRTVSDIDKYCDLIIELNRTVPEYKKALDVVRG